MEYRELRRRCLERVRELDVPEPFEMAEFLRRLGRARGTSIQIVPLDSVATGACGLWVSTPATEYLYVESATTRLHQDHIVCHEVGHMLCQHVGAASLPADVSQTLLPSLDPALIARVLGRTTYSAEEEQEAEMIATLLMHRGRGTPQVSPNADDATAAAVMRLSTSLESPGSRQ